MNLHLTPEEERFRKEVSDWMRSFLSSRGDTVMTGTSEIKRNVIARRSLGLPRQE